jgi:hypothetical protein
MPSSPSSPTLRIPRRKITLVLPPIPGSDVRGQPHSRRTSTSTGADKGADVISRLWETAIHNADPTPPASRDEDNESFLHSQIAEPLSPSPSIISYASLDMAVSAEPAASEEREAVNLPPKSYAEAAEEAISSESQNKSSNGHASLEGEPTDPKEREANRLPKSYAEVAEEAISPELQNNSANNNNHTPLNGEPTDPKEREANNLPKSYAEVAEADISSPRDASTDARRMKNAESTEANGRIRIPLDQDSTQYEGSGLDSSPRSPTRHGHRRKSSLKSNGSIGRKHGEDLNTEVYEKHHNGNGKLLISVKPPKHVEKYTPKPDAPRVNPSTLMSGRQAGAGWQKSKIRWAPLNVPLQRRLQTLAVLMHTLSIAGLLTVFFFLCSIPLLWPIVLPYLIYVLFSNAGTSGELSFRSERCRRLPVWSLFASYFPARLHRSVTLEPTRKYIFGYHPHGIISHGAFAAFATEALGFSQLFPGITNTLLTLDSNFRLPLYREYALRMGLASVSRESIQNILSKGGRNGEGMGRAVTIVVGGARESLESKPGSLRLILRRRKGFIKMAIRTGADLVPVLAFGENEIYQQVDATSHPYLHRFQLLVKKVAGFTVPLFHARGIFNYDVGMMPYRRPINIVVGRPVRVVQEAYPEKETVDRLHQEYTDELLRIWNDYKDTFAKERVAELEIIE